MFKNSDILLKRLMLILRIFPQHKRESRLLRNSVCVCVRVDSEENPQEKKCWRITLQQKYVNNL